MIDLANKIYFDKIRYILSSIPNLNISNDELVVTLCILLLQEESTQVSIESIRNLTGFDVKLIDNVITTLAAKHYLEVVVSGNQVNFSVDNMFSLKEVDSIDKKDVFAIFEDEFSRTFSQKELVRVNEWMKIYSRDELLEGLRAASIMNKLDLNYINRILENNRNG